MRHDPAPLTRRFGALGSPSAVRWQSGTLGESRAPGPTSYAIRAIVVLAAPDARALARLSSPEWRVSAWLEVTSGTIALTAIGGA